MAGSLDKGYYSQGGIVFGTELKQRIQPDGTVWVEWRDDGSTRCPMRVGPLTDKGIQNLAKVTGWSESTYPGITPRAWVLLNGNTCWRARK